MLASRFKDEILPLTDRLYRLALAITQVKQEAEDVVQDVLLRLWERHGAGDSIDNVEAWCITATRNASVDRTRRHHELSLQPSDENRTSMLTPHDHLVASEGRQRLEQFLAELPEVQRSIFVLREAEGKTYNEIASLLNLSDAQVKTYLLRARRKLRERFTPELEACASAPR